MPVLVFALLLAALVFGPGIWVKQVMQRYRRPRDRYPGTGADLARHLLDQHGLQAVPVEETNAGDHYDPTARTVRLSADNYREKSLTAITVAAHEVGHAIQHRDGYRPLKLRTSLVRLIQPIEKVGAGVLLVAPFVGIVTRVPGLGILMFLSGLGTLLGGALVHVVTLPTEFDASFARALPMLDRQGILKRADRPHARRLLTAAALTYVSASLMSLLNIARWWALLRR